MLCEWKQEAMQAQSWVREGLPDSPSVYWHLKDEGDSELEKGSGGIKLDPRQVTYHMWRKILKYMEHGIFKEVRKFPNARLQWDGESMYLSAWSMILKT